MSPSVFSLTDICRAKTVPIEVKDDQGNIEGIVYLKEPGAVAGGNAQMKLTAETPWHEAVIEILTLTLSDADGNSLVNTEADRRMLERMPLRMLFALRDPSLAMLRLSIEGGEKKEEIATGGESIDATLANLDDQVAATYSAPESAQVDNVADVSIPIEGNENLHLDQDPGASVTSTTADLANPFVGMALVPS